MSPSTPTTTPGYPVHPTLTHAMVTEVRRKLYERGISQAELARMMRVSEGRVSQILAAQNLSLRTLNRIADVLCCEWRVSL